MEVIEEQVALNGEKFLKSEIEEISSFCILNSDGLTYKLKSGSIDQQFDLGDNYFVTRSIPVSLLIRKSQAMQKALRATLFISPNETIVIASPELRQALELYRK